MFLDTQIKTKITKLNKKVDLAAVVFILIFLLATFFISSVKAYFVIAFILFGLIVIRYSFLKGIIYTVFPLSYIGVAQIHSVLVVPAKAIFSNQYWEGRHLLFGVSPFLIISAIAFLMVPFIKKSFKKNIKLQIYEKIVIILFGFGFLSGIYGSLMSSLSVFSVFSQLVYIIWSWYLSRTILNLKNISEKTIILNSIFLIISTLITYESLIVFRQTLTQSPIGLLVEVTKFSPSFGLGSDESGGGFRPFGLQAHPNGLANSQLILFFSMWLIYTYIKNLKPNNAIPLKEIFYLNTILVIINVILSLSRAGFIASFIAVCIFFLRHKNQLQNIKKEIIKKLNKLSIFKKLLSILIIFFLIFKLTNRMMNSLYSFSEFGGVNTRETQYAEAFEVFTKSPIFGIGDKMFIPTSYQLFPKGVMSYFPEDVHNGFLLFLIERGLIGFVTYFIFLLILIRKIRNLNLNKEIKSVIYSGMTAGFIMMIFHPEKNLLSNFILLVVALTTINYEKRKFSI